MLVLILSPEAWVFVFYGRSRPGVGGYWCVYSALASNVLRPLPNDVPHFAHLRGRDLTADSRGCRESQDVLPMGTTGMPSEPRYRKVGNVYFGIISYKLGTYVARQVMSRSQRLCFALSRSAHTSRRPAESRAAPKESLSKPLRSMCRSEGLPGSAGCCPRAWLMQGYIVVRIDAAVATGVNAGLPSGAGHDWAALEDKRVHPVESVGWGGEGGTRVG